MNNEKSILFIPSNENHVRLFSQISKHLQNHRLLYLSQEPYKDEDAKKTLKELGIPFKELTSYSKKEPASILKKESVGVVVIGNDTDVIPQWFVNRANNLGISTVLIQDGVMVDVNTVKRGLCKNIFSKKNNKVKFLTLTARLIISKQYKKITYGLGNCTKILVWGKSSQSYLINKGIDIRQIVITGNPKMDENPNLQYVQDDEKVILYAPTDLVSSGIIEDHLMSALIADLCNSIIFLRNVKLIVKPHPREDVKFYKSLSNEFGDKIMVSNEDIRYLISKSSLLITDLSTTAIEALAAKKPVIIYLPDIEKIVNSALFPLDLIAKNIVLYAKDRQSLFDQITKIIDGKWFSSNAMNMVEDYFGPLDNKASQRMSDAIKKLLI